MSARSRARKGTGINFQYSHPGVKYDVKTNLRDVVAELMRGRVDWSDSAGRRKDGEMVLLKKLPARLTTLSCALDAVGVSSKHPAGPLPPGTKLRHIWFSNWSCSNNFHAPCELRFYALFLARITIWTRTTTSETDITRVWFLESTICRTWLINLCSDDLKWLKTVFSQYSLDTKSFATCTCDCFAKGNSRGHFPVSLRLNLEVQNKKFADSSILVIMFFAYIRSIHK